MKALVVQAPGSVSLVDRTTPEASFRDLLVRPDAIGLCGTDLEIVDGRIDPAFVAYPIILGHEWTGSVVEGSSEGPHVGTRVVVEGIVPCGHCARCREGRTNICDTYDEIGFTRDGAAAERISVPFELVHTLDSSVHREDAALIEPAAVVHSALSRVRLQPGMSIAVVGDGTVGLLAAHLLSLWSPGDLVVIGQRPAQEGLAYRSGAGRFVTDPSQGPGRFDVVVEAAGTTSAVVRALGQVRRGGTLVLLGIPEHGELAPIAIDGLVNDDITIVASFSYTSAAWRDVVNLLGSGRLAPRFLVTHRFALQDWEEALSVLRESTGERGKVMLLPD